MNTIKSYKWYLENGCEIVPLKKTYNKGEDYSLTLLDIQADFSDFLSEEKNILSDEKIVNQGENIFNIQKKQLTQKEISTPQREKYVYEIDHLWAYIEWHYNFEDEIKVQKNLVSDVNKLRKIPKLYVSAHIIEGIINEMPKNENICILKYTTYSNFYQKYSSELENLKGEKKKNSIYDICNYIYEVCDIADKSLVFASSPVINTTIKNILSITKSGKKREDFNEEEEAEKITEDEIWQIYISNKIKSINDQWLLVSINEELKNIINNSGDIYFKIFNKYIKEHNDFIKIHDYNIMRKNNNTVLKGKNRDNIFELNNQDNNLNLNKLNKYKINLIFSENKDINFILYKLCLNLGKMNDVVLCTKNKTYNILLNDIDGTLTICLKSFFSKYYKNSPIDSKNCSQPIQAYQNGIDKNNFFYKEEELIKTLSIMGLCKEKIILNQKATIFNNVELLFSYYLLVHNETLNNIDDEDDDGIIYISRKALFENLQFSNEEISSYLLHLQKYSNNNLLYIKNKGFRYIKSEIVYEFLIKMIELISINDNLYEHQYIEKNKMKNNLFTKYQEDLHKVLKKKYGITFLNLFNLIYENLNEFEFLKKNKIPIEKYVILQLCLKSCDIENKNFEYFNLYYNYYFFYEYLNKNSNELTFEDIFENYLDFLHNDDHIDDTLVYFNLFKLHNIISLNILRSSGKVVIHSDKLFTFDMEMLTYIKYIDEIFRNFSSNLMDKIIQNFIKSYQFFLDYGYDKEKTNTNSIDENKSKNFIHNNDIINGKLINTDKYQNRVFFRDNIILNVNNINHICNDKYMFQYFIVVKYYYNENSFSLLEKKLKKFIKTIEENFISSQVMFSTSDLHQRFKTERKKLKSNYCLNYKIFKYQTTSFPHIRLNNNYNDLLNFVYTPLSIHFSIFHENVIYNKKRNSFQLIPSFLLKDNLRSCLTALFTFKSSYYSIEFYPFLNPLLNNKDLIGTIAVPPLRHCRTKLIEKENEKNIEFLETGNIIFSNLNDDIKNYKSSNNHNKKFVEKLCKLYNCNLPVNNFST
ncbi:conserved Plasmodium protein, unknown function [Plasmodium relictum]|uniref:Uncharacterized protein n=1 Tax=Plasmodium relictum TaxID=85471 RepID=A0A1J1HCR1_PLARL|nr:conserved Plasmodium protein, unknown function [Plasmodium relictum]CRH03707.1 conserved Plasmodium protein, unknown function [Plasmodium relictum]